MAFSRDNQYLYLIGGGVISTFRIGTDGTLTALPDTPAGTGLTGIALSPDGQYLYVADHAGNSIAAFAVGSGGGLSPLGIVPTDAGPAGLAVVTRRELLIER